MNVYLEHAGACADCDADLIVRDDGPGIVHMTVAHDETCPTLATYRRADR
ncbi:hypothetical protein ATL40_0757 [Serinibacter salmoneus]|uniref:Uncharacterized protein n=1 Tax=Serinibacter salmoneus TaxID=556530 RepID=A0A2A9D025_9MICO|nr:hypothetical protein ATL40_0757 [Serinibacter salmoneus]